MWQTRVPPKLFARLHPLEGNSSVFFMLKSLICDPSVFLGVPATRASHIGGKLKIPELQLDLAQCGQGGILEHVEHMAMNFGSDIVIVARLQSTKRGRQQEPKGSVVRRCMTATGQHPDWKCELAQTVQFAKGAYTVPDGRGIVEELQEITVGMHFLLGIPKPQWSVLCRGGLLRADGSILGVHRATQGFPADLEQGEMNEIAKKVLGSTRSAISLP